MIYYYLDSYFVIILNWWFLLYKLILRKIIGIIFNNSSCWFDYIKINNNKRMFWFKQLNLINRFYGILIIKDSNIKVIKIKLIKIFWLDRTWLSYI